VIDDETARRMIDEGLELAHASAESFSLMPSARASRAEVDTVRRAIDDALAAGLDFPTRTIRFVFAPDRSRGQAERRPDGALSLTINLASCRTLQEIRETTFHEAAHLHDMAAGTFDQLSVADREWRAINFARTMMEPRS
jgi:hypothetical protein